MLRLSFFKNYGGNEKKFDTPFKVQCHLAG